MNISQLAHASAQVAADSGRVRQCQATPRDGQLAAYAAADIGVVRKEHIHAPLHFAFKAYLASGLQLLLINPEYYKAAVWKAATCPRWRSGI